MRLRVVACIVVPRTVIWMVASSSVPRADVEVTNVLRIKDVFGADDADYDAVSFFLCCSCL